MAEIMNLNTNALTQNYFSHHEQHFNLDGRENMLNSTEINYRYKCPVLFAHDQESEFKRIKRAGDCSKDSYHIFSLLSFLLSSFTTIINIVNNSNLNNNNNNNNNNDNNNNNNNVNVNMMKRRRRKRNSRAVIYTFIETNHSRSLCNLERALVIIA